MPERWWKRTRKTPDTRCLNCGLPYWKCLNERALCLPKRMVIGPPAKEN